MKDPGDFLLGSSHSPMMASNNTSINSDSSPTTPGSVVTLVKICGITNFDDALSAIKAGADFLGFIFYPPSKRSITKGEAQSLISRLRSEIDCPLLVGVFVNETAETVAQILDFCDLDLAQLSGYETPNLISDPTSPLFGRSYKALRPRFISEAEAEVELYLPPAPKLGQPMLLLDAYHASLYGGTGSTVDWSLAAQIAKTVSGLMLAGGLNPENVVPAVRQVRPFAVDVASGVEANPGRKDNVLVHKFIDAAKSAL